ncbi:MAG: nodulation protein NfeD [Spirochaetaceae bacterium]|jgi:membrane-bound serine protease (ClpP class)|nr:nodulation protein NfeD [Spirochaetaceae bacterium]
MAFTRFFSWFILILLSAGLPLSAQEDGIPAPVSTEEAPSTGGDGADATAWIIPIEGDIEPSLVTFVRREARRALNENAQYIIFEIDTFGGRVDSALQITSFIMSLKNAKTIAWVRNGENSMGVSWSAGALIALSCSGIYMAQGTSMGAAAPVTIGADGKTEGTGEKTVAAVRSQIAALAERNGYPTGIALAMVDYDVELWEAEVDGVIRVLTVQELERLESMPPGQPGTPGTIRRVGIISPAGKLLSLTAGEAYRYGLTRGLADDREELLALLGARNVLEESTPSAADSVISFLVSGPVQGLLILLGLVMIFLELQSPGFGIPGTAAIVCFLLVFGASFLLGRVDSLEIILFVLGLGLLAVEIFIIPGFGLIGISGMILIALSLIFSMQDFIIPSVEWEWALMGRNATVVSVGLLAAILGIAVIALLAPKTRMFDALTLKTKIDQTASEGGGWQENGDVESDYKNLLGKTGRTITVLHPIGKAEIDGQVFQVEAGGSYMENGSTVRVIKVQGNTIIVGSV